MSKKKKDPEVAQLKAEVRRLRRLVEPGGGVGKLLRYSDFRRLTMLLLELDDRADPLRAQNTEVVLRKRHHGGHDGIAVLGTDVAIPGYAVGSRRDAGRLGAALARVHECADKVAGIADPEESRGPDRVKIRCGAQACPGKNMRQRPDITYCGFCGRNLIERTPAPAVPPQGEDTAHDAPVRGNKTRTPASRSSEPKAKQKSASASPNGQAPAKQTGSKPGAGPGQDGKDGKGDGKGRSEEEKAAQLEKDRAGLLKALEMAQGGAGKNR